MRLASGLSVALVSCLPLLALPAMSFEGETIPRWRGDDAVKSSHGAPPIQETTVGAELVSALETQTTVRIVVALGLPDRPEAPAPGASAVERGAFVQDLSSAVQAVQAEVLGQLAPGDFTLARRFQSVPALAGVATAAAVQALAALPRVTRIDLDQGGTGSLLEAKALTGADYVNDLGFTGDGVTVAVLDSGLDRDHPDLQDDLGDEACFCSGGGGCCPNGLATQTGAGAAEDDNGHGTNVIGIITSAGTVAPAGVAPDAGIVPVTVLDENNSFCCSSDIVAGLDWVFANHASEVRAVNMSLGTFALFSGHCDEAAAFTMALRDAVENLRAVGIPSFVSSGNEGSSTQISAPACVEQSIAVGAVDDDDDPAAFANSNSVTDVFAPGVSVTATGLAGGTSTFTGTSMAAPHVAGCVADMLQAHEDLTPDAIEERLQETGVSVIDPKNLLTFPRIDCLAILTRLQFFFGALDPATGSRASVEPESAGR